jgi:predicted lipoprotein with Yx(FWY)xxD motif
MTRTRLLMVLLCALVVAACGGRGDSSSDGGSGSAGQVATPAPASTLAPNPDPAESVAVGETALGRTLTDLEGRTLYGFTKDEGGKSSCYDDCAVTWPAFTVRGKVMAGAGVEVDWLATAERRDGTTQVTYKGMPLYYFSGDQQPGDINGQGVGGIWFTVAPDGALIRAGAGGDGRTEDSKSDGGYGYP